jgi:hypothetical protein
VKRDDRPDTKLIALEGCSGRQLELAAQRLQKRFCVKSGGGVSTWDASGIFYELALQLSKDQPPSPRTLVLLYASDLSFRLEWQVRPALQKRQCVIVAPYVETVLAFGASAGLPMRWLKALFRFAPQPGSIYRIQEAQEFPRKLKSASGFVEYACLALQRGSFRWDPRELQQGAIDYLAGQQKLGICKALPKSLLG